MRKVYYNGASSTDRKKFDGQDWLVNEVHEVEDDKADRLLARKFFSEKRGPGRPKKSESQAKADSSPS